MAISSKLKVWNRPKIQPKRRLCSNATFFGVRLVRRVKKDELCEKVLTADGKVERQLRGEERRALKNLKGFRNRAEFPVTMKGNRKRENPFFLLSFLEEKNTKGGKKGEEKRRLVDN